VAGPLREIVGLYRLHRDVPQRVSAFIAEMREIERISADVYDFPLVGRTVLDVGAGQLLLHMIYLTQHNTVTGIDLEVVATGFDPRAYVRMLERNGVRRTIKTVGRKTLQIDSRTRRELRRQLGMDRLPPVRALTMDAADMSFADHSFDFVFSRSVVHHIPDPERALREAARVLEPGGLAYYTLHLYTSDTGCLDPRVTTGEGSLPEWPHLRPSMQHLVIQNAWLNKLRLDDWKARFEQAMPGCRFWLDTDRQSHLEPAARQLQGSGELGDYTLEELLTRTVAVTWRKS
jgi:SAM-dependent methyltransferase